MFGAPGWPELVIVAIIVLLLFGKRLPGVMRSLGSSITQFKHGLHDESDSDDTSKSESDSSTRSQA